MVGASVVEVVDEEVVVGAVVVDVGMAVDVIASMVVVVGAETFEPPEEPRQPAIMMSPPATMNTTPMNKPAPLSIAPTL